MEKARESARERGRRKGQREKKKRLTVGPGSTCQPERALCSRVRPAYFSNLEFILNYCIHVEISRFSPNHGFFSAQHQYTTLWFYTTYCPPTVATFLLHSWMISFGKSNVCSKQLLTNLEDEIFLKGGSVVTPQNFDLVLWLKFCQEIKLFHLFGFISWFQNLSFL